MKIKLLLLGATLSLTGAVLADDDEYVFEAGHPSLQEWLLPTKVPFPAGNEPTSARVDLGHKLFFDPRLSGDKNMSCASCHNPSLGWSDGLPTAKGVKSMTLGRASPTVINTAYNTIQMWDGRKKDLEDQATGPLEATVEMNADMKLVISWLNDNEGYKALFGKAYPGEPITSATLAKAIASYERTVISNNSPFDRWVKGEKNAMTAQQINGFKIFVGKADCALCHSAPNFTDNAFHNLGLASHASAKPDLGRYDIKPSNATRGAFKTPTLRDIERTAPYFHDGSAKTLLDVVEHYDRGGDVATDRSKFVKPLKLSKQEKLDLVAFMKALTSPMMAVTLPDLPLENSK